MHVLEIYNDIIREISSIKEFNAFHLKIIYVPIAAFILRLNPERH